MGSPVRAGLGTPSQLWSTSLPAFTVRFSPWASKLIGRFSIPAARPTNGPSAAIGPPAAPVAIALIASVCLSLARSSTMSPTVMPPSPIAFGACISTMNERPSSLTPSFSPLSIFIAMATLQSPSVGRAARLELMHGHRNVQLQVSMYCPSTRQAAIAALPCLRVERTASRRSAKEGYARDSLLTSCVISTLAPARFLTNSLRRNPQLRLPGTERVPDFVQDIAVRPDRALQHAERMVGSFQPMHGPSMCQAADHFVHQL